MAQRDLRLDPTTGDLDVSGGTLHLTSGTEAIEQSIKIRLQFFKGEWFLDPTAGVDYFGEVLVKNPDTNAVAALFRAKILETPGVASVDSLKLDYDSQARTLSITFTGTDDTGALLQGTV